MGDSRVLRSLWDRQAQAAILKTNGGGEIAADLEIMYLMSF
jgi:hypothetical protein